MKREALDRILEDFTRSGSVPELIEWPSSGLDNLVVTNLRGGAPSLLAAALALEAEAPILLVAPTLEKAEALADGMTFFGAEPLLFPAFETLPFETGEPALHIAAARSRALAELTAPKTARPPFVIAPADALLHRVLPPDAMRAGTLAIEWGEAVDFEALAERLTAMGYARESIVEAPGEFSIRGSIVDVYPAEAEQPFRLDFFGEELESIRRFDPATQRSLPGREEIERLLILPRANVEPALERLKSGSELATVFDLLPPETRVILDGPYRIRQRFDYFDTVAERHWQDLQAHADDEEKPFFLEHGLQPRQWVLTADEAEAALRSRPTMEWVDLSIEGKETAPGVEPVSVGAQSFLAVPPNFKNYVELIREKQLDHYRIMIVCDNNGQAMRLDELLIENRIPSVIVDAPADGEPDCRKRTARPLPPEARDVALVVGELHEGFLFPAGRLMVLTDREMFGRYKRRRIYRKAYQGKSVASPTEIQRGDFVVHAEHGIGRYERIRRQDIDRAQREFLEIHYQDNDKLLVPIDKLHLIQKYASADGREPPLDKLGKKKWERRRKKTREAVRKLAGELLELYARREAAYRPPFGPDTVWQQEFEASFLYQETPDQMRAIEETKRDMTETRPTDRLICGDVGYGKTEVGIRAAFKALTEKKQVAVLVPTTILAQQHFTTFSERLADYPFRVDTISRFRTAAEQRRTLKDLAEGKVDLIVGTHRLLSKDVKFADLGLLVIDEEQRFGVKQKEKIKSLKASVDILTLTATPIPRTLHMALSKLRDLSIISTPPADRLPIKTRTIYFEREHIEEAILRELNRGGQVYFVHNRIASIDDAAETLREMTPQARIAVAHGQMNEHQLEEIMLDFIAGKYDILVSTTIIENGIDIPNVNTIIINRADAFGLAQLYQLRGRVGRDVRQAYAYLILPRGRPITDTATKRLQALEEFTELGMGFSIAMRDMEIRGTGDILGAEQSGAIAEVGFDMYCRLLEEAVMELRGEAPEPPLHPTEIKWPVDQWLPETYVPVESQRIRYYRELAGARARDAIDLIEEELLDRFGALPDEAADLIAAFRLKTALAPWRVDTVNANAPEMIRLMGGERNRALAEELALRAKRDDAFDRVTLRSEGTVVVYLREEKTPDSATLRAFAAMLEGLPAPATEEPAAVG